MTEVEALAAVKAAKIKVHELLSEQAALREKAKTLQKQQIEVQKRLSALHNTVYEYDSGELVEAHTALKNAMDHLSYITAPKIDGVPTLSDCGLVKATPSTFVIANQVGLFTVHRKTGKVSGSAGPSRNLSQSEMEILDAFVASLEGK